EMNAGGQALADSIQLGVNAVVDGNRIGAGLPVDAQKNARFAIRCDDCIEGLLRLVHAGNVAHLDRHPCGGFLYNNAGDFARIMHLAIEKLKHELVVTLNQAWRLDKIGPLDGAKNVLHGDPARRSLPGSGTMSYSGMSSP